MLDEKEKIIQTFFSALCCYKILNLEKQIKRKFWGR